MNRRNALINLIFCSILHGFNHYLIIFSKPMYTSMTEYFSLETVSQITSRMTIIYVGYAISNFLSGILARRYSLKLILFFGTLLMSISTMLVRFVPADSYYLMSWLVFFIGLGGGTYHPAANTLVTASYEDKPGHAIGMLSIGAVIGFVVAPFVGEHIGLRIGFQNLFLISGATTFIFSFLMLNFVTDFDRAAYVAHVNKISNNTKHQHTGKALIAVIILMCIPVTIRELVLWSYYEITPFWVEYGFSAGIAIGVVQSMQYMPGLIVQPLTGKLCDKISPFTMVIITFAIMAVGTMLLAGSSAPAIWAAIIIFGIGASSSTVASETFMAYITTAKDRPIVYGIAISVGLGLGGFLSGFSGMVVDHYSKDAVTGYRVWFISMGCILMLSTTIYFVLKQVKSKHAGLNNAVPPLKKL